MLWRNFVNLGFTMDATAEHFSFHLASKFNFPFLTHLSPGAKKNNLTKIFYQVTFERIFDWVIKN